MEIRDGNPHTHPVAQLSSTTIACGLPSPTTTGLPTISQSVQLPLSIGDQEHQPIKVG